MIAAGLPTVRNAPETSPEPPVFPERLEDLDVDAGFLTDLALKIVSLQAESTTSGVAEQLRLGMMITETLLQRLVHEQAIEIKGLISIENHRYAMLERGWARVERLMRFCNYVGPAPVSLDSYSKMLTEQVRQRAQVLPAALEEATSDLVLSEQTKETLLLVANSGRSLFLSGPPGNGKTAMARALVQAIPGQLWIPFAIEVDGQVLRVFDAHCHDVYDTNGDLFDFRWVKIRPPLVVVGGDLTLQNLELVNSETQRFYEAPFQLKSNGGVLVVDDLGRQRCSARELLNRWIIPLEYRVDYLTLSTGKKIQVPFEQTVVFATNLTGGDLEDEAFLRRMGYRLSVSAPSDEIYAEIFQRYAQWRGLPVDGSVIEHLLQRYRAERRQPKCCEPRDLIERTLDRCEALRQPAALTAELMDSAWNSYFGVTG